MAPKVVDVIAKDRVYSGYFQIDRYRLRHEKFDGTLSDTLTREVFERGHVSAVLPVDPQRDEVVLIEQFRPGAYAAGGDSWLLECVAGVIEAGETSEDVAIREAHEEAGCVITALHPLGSYLSSPGASSETVYLYCGRTTTAAVGGVHGLSEEGEDIRVRSVPVADAIAWLDAGRIKNAKTIIALQWLARHYPRLRAYWAPDEPLTRPKRSS